MGRCPELDHHTRQGCGDGTYPGFRRVGQRGWASAWVWGVGAAGLSPSVEEGAGKQHK